MHAWKVLPIPHSWLGNLRWYRYGGDVWPQQPAPKDHPWRHMPNHAMTPHLSGTTLDAQVRFAVHLELCVIP